MNAKKTEYYEGGTRRKTSSDDPGGPGDADFAGYVKEPEVNPEEKPGDSVNFEVEAQYLKDELARAQVIKAKVAEALARNPDAAKPDDGMARIIEPHAAAFDDASPALSKGLETLRADEVFWNALPEYLREGLDRLEETALLYAEVMNCGPCGICYYENNKLAVYSRALAKNSELSPRDLVKEGATQEGVMRRHYPVPEEFNKVNEAVASLSATPAYVGLFPMTPESQHRGRTLTGLKTLLGKKYDSFLRNGWASGPTGEKILLRRVTLKWVTQELAGGRLSFAVEPSPADLLDREPWKTYTKDVQRIDPETAPTGYWRRTRDAYEAFEKHFRNLDGASADVRSAAGIIADQERALGQASKILDAYLCQDAHHPVAFFEPRGVTEAQAAAIQANCEHSAAASMALIGKNPSGRQEDPESDFTDRDFRQEAKTARAVGKQILVSLTVQFPKFANAEYCDPLWKGKKDAAHGEKLAWLRSEVLRVGDLTVATYRGKHRAYAYESAKGLGYLQQAVVNAANLIKMSEGDAVILGKALEGLNELVDGVNERKNEGRFGHLSEDLVGFAKAAAEAVGDPKKTKALAQKMGAVGRSRIGYRGAQFVTADGVVWDYWTMGQRDGVWRLGLRHQAGAEDLTSRADAEAEALARAQEEMEALIIEQEKSELQKKAQLVSATPTEAISATDQNEKENPDSGIRKAIERVKKEISSISSKVLGMFQRADKAKTTTEPPTAKTSFVPTTQAFPGQSEVPRPGREALETKPTSSKTPKK